MYDTKKLQYGNTWYDILQVDTWAEPMADHQTQVFVASICPLHCLRKQYCRVNTLLHHTRLFSGYFRFVYPQPFCYSRTVIGSLFFMVVDVIEWVLHVQHIWAVCYSVWDSFPGYRTYTISHH